MKHWFIYSLLFSCFERRNCRWLLLLASYRLFIFLQLMKRLLDGLRFTIFFSYFWWLDLFWNLWYLKHFFVFVLGEYCLDIFYVILFFISDLFIEDWFCSCCPLFSNILWSNPSIIIWYLEFWLFFRKNNLFHVRHFWYS